MFIHRLGLINPQGNPIRQELCPSGEITAVLIIIALIITATVDSMDRAVACQAPPLHHLLSEVVVAEDN
jgi:hypothetical protein